MHDMRKGLLASYASKFGRCHVCGLYVANRNRKRHEIACARRRREDPEAWLIWRESHYDKPVPKRVVFSSKELDKYNSIR